MNTPFQFPTYEEWKPVVGWEEAYQISNIGNVKSLQRTSYYSNGATHTVYEKILKNVDDGKGYYRVRLSVNGKNRSCFVHQLVAQAFLQHIPGKTDVNHINGTKTDNRVENLEWCTKGENVRHAWRVGLNKIQYEHLRKQSQISNAKRRIPIAVIKDGSLVTTLASQNVIANFLGISKKIWVKAGMVVKRSGYTFQRMPDFLYSINQ